MAVENQGFASTFVAGEDLNAALCLYHAIALVDGKLANTAEETSGILISKPKTGEFGTIRYSGELKFAAGGAITKGGKVTVATSGWFTAANSEDTVVGEAKAAVTSGSIGAGYFTFAPVVDRGTFLPFEITPTDTTIVGVAMALNDMKLANTGIEADGVTVRVLSSGTAGNVAAFGVVPLRMDPAEAASAGDALTVTASGYFSIAASDSYICAKALTAINSGALGTGLFTGLPLYAFSSSFIF
jgi:hypothetical protein